jgi:hypothetical protein
MAAEGQHVASRKDAAARGDGPTDSLLNFIEGRGGVAIKWTGCRELTDK